MTDEADSSFDRIRKGRLRFGKEREDNFYDMDDNSYFWTYMRVSGRGVAIETFWVCEIEISRAQGDFNGL